MRVLGIDPGLRATGWAALLVGGAFNERPARSDYVRATSTTSYHNWGQLIALTGTLRRRDRTADEWTKDLCDAIGWISVLNDIELVAVEDFTHRPWMRRRVNTAPEMGKLVGSICQDVRVADRAPLIVVRAEDSKRGMDGIRPFFRNPHEHSAVCAALYGESAYRLEAKS